MIPIASELHTFEQVAAVVPTAIRGIAARPTATTDGVGTYTLNLC